MLEEESTSITAVKKDRSILDHVDLLDWYIQNNLNADQLLKKESQELKGCQEKRNLG